MNFILFFLITVLRVEKYALLLRVLLSWVQPDPSGKLNQVLFQITEPILAPIRSILPRTGMVDLSPLIAFFALDLAQIGVMRLFY